MNPQSNLRIFFGLMSNRFRRFIALLELYTADFKDFDFD